MDWPFIESNDKSKTTKSSFEIECAIKLYNVLSKKRIANRYSKIAWAGEFQKLIKLDKKSQEDIKSTLEWYCNHIGEEYTPEAHDAKSFRTKFGQIKKHADKSNDTPIEMSENATILYKEMKGKHWPPTIKNSLPRIIQKSIDNYTNYWKRVLSLREDLKAKVEKHPRLSTIKDKKQCSAAGYHQKDLMFLENLIQLGRLCRPRAFIRDWLNHIQMYYEKFQQWDGDANSAIFSETNEKFERWGFLWADNWCSDPQRWIRLRDKIKVVKLED